MADLAYEGYTDEEVREVLHSESRVVRFSYMLLDRTNQPIRTLGNVESCTVKHNYLADIKRTANFKIRDDGDIDFLTQRIQPRIEFRMPDGSWAVYPLGVFLLDAPKLTYTDAGVPFRDVDAYDLGRIIQSPMATVNARFAVTKGTAVVPYVESLLSNAGINEHEITESDETLSATREWDQGTTVGKIINDLLEAIGYESISFDANGRAISRPYEVVFPDQDTYEHLYETNDLSVILPGATVELDYYDVPNRITLIASQADRPALYATATNSDPASPTSTVSRGFVVHKVLTDDDSTSQKVIDTKVRRLLTEASSLFETTTFKTALMPGHGNNDSVKLVHSQLGVSAVFRETGWEMPLKVNAEMTHHLRKTVTL